MTHIVKMSLPLALLAMVGCSGMSAQQQTGQANASDSQLAQREAELAAREAAVRRREQEVARTTTTASRSSSTRVATGIAPPTAKPGECFSRALVPAVYRPVTKRVLKSEASERIEIIPAKYTWATERVMVADGYTQWVVAYAGKTYRIDPRTGRAVDVRTGKPVPGVKMGPNGVVFEPTFKTVTERVMVKPPRRKVVEIPSKFKTVTERVIDKPAHSMWKRGANLPGTVTTRTTDTGEIMCLVEVPATYKTITKRVLANKASTKVVNIPAEYKNITRRVAVAPPKLREVKVAPKYDTIKVQKLVTAAQERRIPVPATYETITTTERVREARVEWRQVYCEVNMTKELAVRIQQALTRTGDYKGPIDGIVGTQTQRSLNRYEKRKGLPTGTGFVPFETARSLGVL